MLHRILHQIDQHLFHKHTIHGDQDQRLRQLQLHPLLRIALVELLKGRIHQFVRSRQHRCDLHISAVDAGDGKQILHHADQPLGVLLNAQKHGFLLAVGEPAAVFPEHGGGAVDGGQGCPQIMGNGPEQIGPHFFPLALGLHGLLMLDLRGQGTGHHRDHSHDRSGISIGRDHKIQFKVRKGKRVIHQQQTGHRGSNAPAIAVGEQRNEKYRKSEGGGDLFRDPEHILHQQTHHKTCGQNPDGHKKVPYRAVPF